MRRLVQFSKKPGKVGNDFLTKAAKILVDYLKQSYAVHQLEYLCDVARQLADGSVADR